MRGTALECDKWLVSSTGFSALGKATVRDGFLSPALKSAVTIVDTIPEPMSTRSSIWLGESDGKSVHIYWELAGREIENGRMTGTPIYIAVEAGNADEEVAIRLPKEIAMRLLMALSSDWADKVRRVL